MYLQCVAEVQETSMAFFAVVSNSALNSVAVQKGLHCRASMLLGNL